MKKKLLDEAGKSYLVQSHQLDKAKENAVKIDSGLAKLNATIGQNQIELDELTASLEEMLSAKGIDINNLDDVVVSDDIEQRIALSEDERNTFNKYIPVISPIETVTDSGNWDDYINHVDEYIIKYELDTEIDPLIQLLPPAEAAKLLNNYKVQFGDLKWNKWDYSAVGLSALVAILADIFIVSIPKDMNWNGKLYKGSPVTKFLKGQSQQIMNPGENANQFQKWMHQSQQAMEKYAKVPYDVSVNRADNGLSAAIEGLSPKTHRLQSLGHDPIMGFVFGIFDIMRGSVTSVGRDGVFSSMPNSNYSGTSNIFEAFTRQIAHLLSDIPTAQGIPVPFMGILQSIDSKSPFRLPQGNSGQLGEQVNFNDLSSFMYTHGYTMEHFATMSLVPMIVEIGIRTYYKLANFNTIFPSRDLYNPNKDVKLQTMLTFGHSITMGGNVVKMWINGWNPTSFNWAEMLVLIKTFFSLFMANRARNKEIDNFLLEGWDSINANCISYNL